MADVVKATPSKELAAKAKKLYLKHFSDKNDEDLVFAIAPGRVNLIGEHTDYCAGYVFPMAINLVTIVCGKLNGTDSTINLVSANMFNEGDDDNCVDSEKLENCGAKTSFDARNVEKLDSTHPAKWSNYVRGVAHHFHEKSEIKGFDAVIISTVPIGGGLSSSASLEVGFYTFIENLFVLYNENLVDKAHRCKKAEHEYADVPCGIMDQFISTCGKLGHASLIDCESEEIKHISMPDPEISILIINSNKKHELSCEGEYTERRNSCFKAAELCGKSSLRKCSMQDINENVKDELMIKRAKHVIGEIKRTKQASEYLAFGDYDKFGDLMNQSHNSLRDDFQVSTSELDQLVDLARECKSNGLGVYGSRMTGGGFGGCTVTLVAYQDHEKVIEYINERYSGKATFFLAYASEGARGIQF